MRREREMPTFRVLISLGDQESTKKDRKIEWKKPAWGNLDRECWSKTIVNCQKLIVRMKLFLNFLVGAKNAQPND